MQKFRICITYSLQIFVLVCIFIAFKYDNNNKKHRSCFLLFLFYSNSFLILFFFIHYYLHIIASKVTNSQNIIQKKIWSEERQTSFTNVRRTSRICITCSLQIFYQFGDYYLIALHPFSNFFLIFSFILYSFHSRLLFVQGGNQKARFLHIIALRGNKLEKQNALITFILSHIKINIKKETWGKEFQTLNTNVPHPSCVLFF